MAGREEAARTACPDVGAWKGLKMLSSEDQRAHPRFLVRISVAIRSLRLSWPGTILDFSESGMFVASDRFPRVGDALEFRFQRPGDRALVEVEGEVMREVQYRPPLGFGVRFNEPLSSVEPVN